MVASVKGSHVNKMSMWAYMGVFTVLYLNLCVINVYVYICNCMLFVILYL